MVASADPPSFGAPTSAAYRAVFCHNLCRPCWVFDRRGLVRSDRVVDDAESEDLHVQGVAVGDHATELVLVLQGAEPPFDEAVGLG